jgi:hypothetical protein
MGKFSLRQQAEVLGPGGNPEYLSNVLALLTAVTQQFKEALSLQKQRSPLPLVLPISIAKSHTPRQGDSVPTQGINVCVESARIVSREFAIMRCLCKVARLPKVPCKDFRL